VEEGVTAETETSPGERHHQGRAGRHDLLACWWRAKLARIWGEHGGAGCTRERRIVLPSPHVNTKIRLRGEGGFRRNGVAPGRR